MAKLALDCPVPAFTLPSTQGGDFRLTAAKGEKLVLYFYPKDSTPGCTTESAGFGALHAKFRRLGVRVVGISRDSLESHAKFRAKLDLPFHLLSDQDEKVCKLFDVIREKNMYGRKVLGIERSTFLVDGKGILRREWRKVKVAGHVEEVLEAARSID